MAGFTATALMAASVGMQVIGQVQSGMAAREAADYNAQVYREKAANIQVKKDITTVQYNRALKQLRGETVVAVSGQGRDLSGSALHVLNDNLTQMELDKSIELYNLDIDKRRALSGADEHERTGDREMRSSLFQAGSTILTAGNAWYQKSGGFGKVT